MTERMRFKGEPRELSFGEIFKPFDTPIKPLSLQGEGQTIARFEFVLNGIEGRLTLYQEYPSLVNDYRQGHNFVADGLSTPLGPVREVIGIGDDGMLHLEDAFSTLNPHFMVHSEEEAKALHKMAMEVVIGGKKFYLIPKFDDSKDIYDLESALEGVRRNGYAEAVDKEQFDENGKNVFIWLPYRPEDFRKIKARFVEKPFSDIKLKRRFSED